MVSVAYVGMMGVLPTFFILAGYAVCLLEHPTVFGVFERASFALPLVEALPNKETLADLLVFFGLVFLILPP